MCVFERESESNSAFHYKVTTNTTTQRFSVDTQPSPALYTPAQLLHQAADASCSSSKPKLLHKLLFPGDLEKENIDASFKNKYAVNLRGIKGIRGRAAGA